jgi:hypothetical protein
MPNENDYIKITDVVTIIEGIKNDKVPVCDLAKWSDRILDHIESRIEDTRTGIRRSFQRIPIEDFELILITLMQAGLIEEVATSRRIVYRCLK